MCGGSSQIPRESGGFLAVTIYSRRTKIEQSDTIQAPAKRVSVAITRDCDLPVPQYAAETVRSRCVPQALIERLPKRLGKSRIVHGNRVLANEDARGRAGRRLIRVSRIGRLTAGIHAFTSAPAMRHSATMPRSGRGGAPRTQRAGRRCAREAPGSSARSPTQHAVELLADDSIPVRIPHVPVCRVRTRDRGDPVPTRFLEERGAAGLVSGACDDRQPDPRPGGGEGLLPVGRQARRIAGDAWEHSGAAPRAHDRADAGPGDGSMHPGRDGPELRDPARLRWPGHHRAQPDVLEEPGSASASDLGGERRGPASGGAALRFRRTARARR